MKTTRYWVIALATIAIVPFAGTAARAQAVEVRYDPIGKTVNLDADNADIRQVVRDMMRAIGISRYRIDPGIDAKITLKLRNATTQNALQTALARAGAEYEM